MGAKRSLFAAIYEYEWHKIRKKAAGAGRDESSKRMSADERMQSLYALFSEYIWQIHKASSRGRCSPTPLHPL
jgi:hypothetical protein